jgi:hypothetical protein
LGPAVGDGDNVDDPTVIKVDTCHVVHQLSEDEARRDLRDLADRSTGCAGQR